MMIAPSSAMPLKRGAIEGYFVRDAIDYQIVCRRRVMADASERYEFRDYRSLTTFIDVSNQGFRKSLLPAN